MKAIGVVRRIDRLGRIALPTELRQMLYIAKKDPFEIFIDGEQIFIKKYQSSCIFCEEVNNLKEYKGKNICQSCLNELKTQK